MRNTITVYYSRLQYIMSEADYVSVESIEEIVNTQMREAEQKSKHVTFGGEEVHHYDNGNVVANINSGTGVGANTNAVSTSKNVENSDIVTSVVSVISILFDTLKRYAIELFITTAIFIVFTRGEVNKYIHDKVPLLDSYNSELVSSAVIGALFAVSLIIVKLCVSVVA